MTLNEIDQKIRLKAEAVCKSGGMDYYKDLTFEEKMTIRASVSSMMTIQLLQEVAKKLTGTGQRMRTL